MSLPLAISGAEVAVLGSLPLAGGLLPDTVEIITPSPSASERRASPRTGLVPMLGRFLPGLPSLPSCAAFLLVLRVLFRTLFAATTFIPSPILSPRAPARAHAAAVSVDGIVRPLSESPRPSGGSESPVGAGCGIPTGSFVRYLEGKLAVSAHWRRVEIHSIMKSQSGPAKG